jgi:hypothetical protein
MRWARDPCRHFNQGDQSPVANVKSVFNCHTASGKCHYFYPVRFFHPTCGLGRDYISMRDSMEEQRKNQTLWEEGMPPIIIPYGSFRHIGESSIGDGERNKLQRLSMVHVHKAGGTSIVRAFQENEVQEFMGETKTWTKQLKKGHTSMKARGKMSNAFIIYAHGRSQRKDTLGRNAAKQFLKNAVKYQSEWIAAQHTIFVVVRDPVERFISAIGQATANTKTSPLANQLRDRCLHDKAALTLECFVRLIETNGTLVDLHFTPMVMEIAFATMNIDVPIAVFPFSDLPSILAELGADPNVKRKDGRKNIKYGDIVALNMTVSDLNQSLLERLCRVYWVDVIFLNHMGYPSRCDAFL